MLPLSVNRMPLMQRTWLEFNLANRAWNLDISCAEIRITRPVEYLAAEPWRGIFCMARRFMAGDSSSHRSQLRGASPLHFEGALRGTQIKVSLPIRNALVRHVVR